jgi:uncharacterized protein (TIGR03435 family)
MRTTRRKHHHRLLPFLFPLLLSHSAIPQAPSPAASPSTTQPATPIYDVASITPSKSDNDNTSIETHDATFSATNIQFRNLVSNAYDIREGLISGLPPWAESARFDIRAKIVDPDLPALKGLKKKQRAAMLAQILTDRFHLKVHTETKILPVYNLVVTSHGPKFKPSPDQSSDHSGMSANDQDVTLTSAPISSLTYFLVGSLNRTIIDKTNLTGKYDLHLTWAPDRPAMAGSDAGQPDDAGPSLFSALQDQLGLKLDPAKGPVITLVVDHIDPPSPN